MKSYRITFDTKLNGYRSWVMDVSAENLSDARKIAEDRWSRRYNYYGKIPHMFHIHVRLLKAEEEFLYHWFKEID